MPILNQRQYQQNSEANIDTITVRSASVSTFTNTPSFGSGFVLGGTTYYSLAAVNAILNQTTRQAGAALNIDTGTIRLVNVSTFSNIPSLPSGISIGGATYNSIGATNEAPYFPAPLTISRWSSAVNYGVGDYVTKPGAAQIYSSLISNNLNFALPNQSSDSNWHYVPEGEPIGTIHAYGGASAPTNFLICNGAEVSRTDYAALFAVIGTRFGAGDGSTTFNVPNAYGKVLAGKDGATFSEIGVTVGAETHQHTIPTEAAMTTTKVADAPHTAPVPNQASMIGLLSSPRAGSWPGGAIVMAGIACNSVIAAGINTYTSFCQTIPGLGHQHQTPTHNHGGNTGSASTVQPTLVVIYIIKAS